MTWTPEFSNYIKSFKDGAYLYPEEANMIGAFGNSEKWVNLNFKTEPFAIREYRERYFITWEGMVCAVCTTPRIADDVRQLISGPYAEIHKEICMFSLAKDR